MTSKKFFEKSNFFGIIFGTFKLLFYICNVINKQLTLIDMKTQFSIYQVNNANENARNIMFSSMRIIKRMNLPLSIDIYKKVYEGEIESEGKSINSVLEDIYNIFNVRRPEDFKGHSLSTSDVVLLNGRYYFCDSFGWVKVEL